MIDPAPESIDLRVLVEQLRQRLGPAGPCGFLDGKVVFRDAVAELANCSCMEAEDVVETLVAQGYLRYAGDPAEPDSAEERWALLL